MTSVIEDDWILVTDDDVCLIPDKTVKTMPSHVKDPGLPASKPTVSSWLIPPDSLANYRSSAVLPSDVVDVVIVGSGFSGTSVAWHLLHGDGEPRPKHLSCLMLEARDICSGATGRNGPQPPGFQPFDTLMWRLTLGGRRTLVMQLLCDVFVR